MRYIGKKTCLEFWATNAFTSQAFRVECTIPCMKQVGVYRSVFHRIHVRKGFNESIGLSTNKAAHRAESQKFISQNISQGLSEFLDLPSREDSVDFCSLLHLMSIHKSIRGFLYFVVDQLDHSTNWDWDWGWLVRRCLKRACEHFRVNCA